MCRPGSRVCPLTPCREGVRVTTGETCEATRAFTCDQCFESHTDQCRLFGPSRELGSPPDQLIIKIDSGAHASNLSPIDAARRGPGNPYSGRGNLGKHLDVSRADFGGPRWRE